MPYRVNDDKIRFLADAGNLLSSTLDYHVTLASVAKLIVDNLADFCIIDVVENGDMKRVAVRCSLPAKNKLVQKFFDYLPDKRNKMAIYDAASSGEPIVIKKATKNWLKTVTRIRAERDLVLELGMQSLIFAPLTSRGKVIGVLTIASVVKGFSYSDDDVVFVEELARRAGLAVDNARLFTEAHEAIRERDEFLSIASHELKTPLTNILLSLQLILRRIKNTSSKSVDIDEISKAIEVSMQQSHRMSRLINDLLSVSTISTRRFRIEREKVELNSLVAEVATRFESLLKEKKNKLTIVNKNKAINGMWDRVRIEQVISNLLSNAIKYGKGKPISITVEKEKKNAVIKIKDRGIGVNEEVKEKIFDLFSRGVSPQEFRGIGVGLYISREITEAHGGRLTVESDTGKGSEFIIELPILPQI